MSCDVKLKVGINLKRFATVKVATLLWGQPDVKKNIAKYFTTGKMSWGDICEKVVRNSNFLCLPGTVLFDLEDIILQIGKRMHTWTKYVVKGLKLDVSYALTVCWTEQGLIDEMKIFEIWQRGKFPLSHFSRFFYLNATCTYAEKEFVRSHEKEIIRDLRDFYDLDNFYKDKAVVLKCWFTNQNNLNFLSAIDRTFEDVIYFNYVHLLKYFWSKMSVKEQMKCIEEISNSPYARYFFWRIYTGSSLYEKERRTQLLIFLINNMTKEQKLNFLSQDFGKFLLKNIIFTWPFQEFFSQILQIYQLSQENNVELFFELVSGPDALKLKYSCLHKRSYPKFLEMFWLSAPVALKQKISNHPDTFPKIITRHANLSAVELLLNDQNLQNYRTENLKKCEEEILNLLKKGNFNFLMKFLEILTPAERKEFKFNLNFLKGLVLSRRFNYADKFLSFLTIEENFLLKSRLDCVGICRGLLHSLWNERDRVRKGSRLIGKKYLNWQFDDWDEREKFKKALIGCDKLSEAEICIFKAIFQCY